MSSRGVLVALASAAVLTSCDWYEKNTVQEISGPVPAGARIKFFNFGVGSPGVNFYADTRKMTATLSATGRESPIGVTYGNAGDGGFYAAIAPGQYTLSGKIADTAAAVHDLAISNVTATLAEEKAYSFYLSGIYDAATKTVDAFIVEDNFPPQINYAVAYVRFVQASSNANPMTLYALTAADTTQVIALGTEIAYKGAGVFTGVPGGVYHLRARYAGGANAITRNTVTFLAGRVYTIGARGDITVASTVALDNTANR
jgi:hypothetical protein